MDLLMGYWITCSPLSTLLRVNRTTPPPQHFTPEAAWKIGNRFANQFPPPSSYLLLFIKINKIFFFMVQILDKITFFLIMNF